MAEHFRPQGADRRAKWLVRHFTRSGVLADLIGPIGARRIGVRLMLSDGAPADLWILPLPEPRRARWELLAGDGEVVRSGRWRGNHRLVLSQCRALLQSLGAIARGSVRGPVDQAAVERVIARFVNHWSWPVSRETARYAEALVAGLVSPDERDPATVAAALPSVEGWLEAELSVLAIHALATGAFSVESLQRSYGAGFDGIWQFEGPEFPQCGISPEQFARAFKGDVIAAARIFLRACRNPPPTVPN